MRCNKLEFPLTLGRDFTGKIIQMGMSVNSNFDINDIVWGVVPVHSQGCHSDYIVIDSSYVSHLFDFPFFFLYYYLLLFALF